MIMGVATTLIGFLPTYDMIGVWAPVLLITLRLIQGFGVGGEWGGAVLVAVEHAPKTKKGLAGSWPQVGVPVGLLTANTVFLVSNLVLGQEAFVAWGWRIGFIGSALLIIVGLVIRLKMEETPDFAQVKESDEIVKFPVVEMFRTQWRPLLLAAGVKISQNAIFYIITVFVLTYVSQSLGMPDTVALTGVMIACVISIFTLMFFGWLSDQFGRRRVYLFGAVGAGLFAFPFFALLDTKNVLLIVVAIVIGMVLHDVMYGPQAAFMTEMFAPKVRYTGTSLGYQLASTVAGAVSPVLAVYLLGLADNHAWPIALYIIGVSIVTVVCTVLSPETHRGNRRRPRTGQADLGLAPMRVSVGSGLEQDVNGATGVGTETEPEPVKVSDAR
jgi:MFS transporter, MHS family, shikimate and dehydroshikimate transport protein